ncbi:helix-turn-helix domain-containing protein [Novosphingobium cyanobacteriorum]|uniref:Helix-turn-helix domain-containing protein n=1 Tax=Novosphingobium cyanobacteriorum TaxID=3024215 RepID=A0ABT6CM01_9SPHN|nr:helix-turn-helix domain-containing protein [Novosphingobium cyanobacteriorum]MDF8334946.1 helix-turn-helix domain-containing protein [Novosphingobium cyanobacteriorum]
MATVLREKKIKSADRVLEIFEMFSADRQEVTVMDVARTLNVPQSSTSELLGSLVRRGYLQRDRAARTFRPTARVALLGAWVQPQLFRHGRLLPMMDSLQEETGEGVVLASMIGLDIKHVHVVGDSLPEALASGTEHHVLHSPFGIALLSAMYRGNVRALVHRLNAESDPSLHVRYSDLEVQLNRASKQGYVVGELGNGVAAVVVLLPQRLGEEQLVIGIAGSSERIHASCGQLVQTLRGAIANRFVPRTRPELREVERAQIAAVH